MSVKCVTLILEMDNRHYTLFTATELFVRLMEYLPSHTVRAWPPEPTWARNRPKTQWRWRRRIVTAVPFQWKCVLWICNIQCRVSDSVILVYILYIFLKHTSKNNVYICECVFQHGTWILVSLCTFSSPGFIERTETPSRHSTLARSLIAFLTAIAKRHPSSELRLNQYWTEITRYP